METFETMDSENPYRKLNAYFLEVCTDFLDLEVHGKWRVPKSSAEMYQDLTHKLATIHGKSYERVINEASFLSKEQKGYLLPQCKKINMVKLDPAMYIKIIRLLEGKKKESRSKFLNNTRNAVSHISMDKLRGNGNQINFEKDFKNLKKSFQFYGFQEKMLNECYNKVFKKRED